MTTGTILSFEHLRAANLTRHVRYHARPADAWGHDDWLVAIGGEVGEALNVVKKLNRARNGMLGNVASESELRTSLGSELADVVIYLDILLSKFRTRCLGDTILSADHLNTSALRDLSEASFAFRKPHRQGLSSDGRSLLRSLGLLVELVPMSGAELATVADRVLRDVDKLAYQAEIDLGAAIIAKFNATSEKLGFPERLAA